MGKTLKDLWFNYAFDQCGMIESDEEKEALGKAAEIEEELTAELSERQKKKLEDYSDHLQEMNLFFANRAFERGIRFATAYLLEALHEK